MLQKQGTAVTSTSTTEEDWFRRYNANWRDTAAGRSDHYTTCPAPRHPICGGAR